MTTGVNLVPTSFLHACARARRRQRWIAACAGIVVLFSTGWCIQRAAGLAVARLAVSVRDLEAQRTEVQRQFTLAATDRTRLVERLQVVAAARHAQPWAERFVQLSRNAPDGIFLTSLSIGPPRGSASALASAGRDARPAAPPTASTADTAAPPDASEHGVRILGYALDHAALIQFLNRFQERSGWQHAELVRATQETYRHGQAVAFELECSTREARP